MDTAAWALLRSPSLLDVLEHPSHLVLELLVELLPDVLNCLLHFSLHSLLNLDSHLSRHLSSEGLLDLLDVNHVHFPVPVLALLGLSAVDDLPALSLWSLVSHLAGDGSLLHYNANH